MSEIIVSTPVTEDIAVLFDKHGLARKTVVLFDENTRKLIGNQILDSLDRQGFIWKELVIPARETSKSFRTAMKLYTEMIEAHVD
ncbi:MAG: 3-dehydroquinate synthase, partial [Prosthecochloris sp.]|nr:3-dehydroquinate synthase [Prosthecochloris sp.]